jgi:hypothetical protein
VAATDASPALLADVETVADRLEAIELSAAGRAAAAGGDLFGAVRKLHKSGSADDAVAILGQVLADRASVWWACLVARAEPPAATAAVGPADEKEAAAVDAAEAWVRFAGAEHAATARAAAELAGVGTPAGAAAMAAFFAQGNLAPGGAQPVPPPPHLAGLFSSTAVTLAAVRRNPVEADRLKRQSITLGLAVAAGEHPWADEPAGGE